MYGIADIVNYLKSLTPPAAVCRTRNPQSSDYYKCVEDHLKPFSRSMRRDLNTTALPALINAGYER